MQAGSQVSLEYDINLSLTQIPENLIFYSDSARTNAIYKENGSIHLEGYFNQATANKTESRTLYWEWPMETGSTQNQINENDLLDSNWIGDRIVLAVSAKGRQVTEENLTQQYAVTLDANGGTIQGYGNSSQATKMVTYGETYGTLPTPTREGYRFIGWTNVLTVEGKTGKFWVSTLASISPYFQLDTNYTVDYDFSIDEPIPEGYEIFSQHQWGDIRINYDNTYTPVLATFQKTYGTNYIVGETYHLTNSLKTPETGLMKGIVFYTARVRNIQTQNVADDIVLSGTFSNICFYQGNAMLHNISNNTNVIVNTNHTLLAEWEPISNP